jgi:tetratricopeptide (TPR) repeat protein
VSDVERHRPCIFQALRALFVVLATAASCLLFPSLLAAQEDLDSLRYYSRYLLAEEGAVRERALERALSLDPESAYLHYELAQRALRRRDLDGAIAEANEALRLDHEQIEARTLLANIYARLAERIGEGQAALVEKAIEHLDGLTRHPNAHIHVGQETWETLAEMLELRGRLVRDEATESMERALLAWKQVDGKEARQAAILATLGRAHEAAELLRGELAERPDWTDGRARLAELLEGLGDWEGAAAQWSLLLESQPGDHRSRIRMGRALGEAGRGEEAASVFEMVTQTPGVSPEANRFALVFLGDQLEQLRRYPDAERAYREALDADPEDHEVRLQLAIFYQDRGRIVEAREEIDRLLASLPPQSDPWFELTTTAASLLSQQGRLEEATRMLEQALERKPDDPELQLALIEALMARGEYRRAERIAARKRRQVEDPGTFWVIEGQAALMRQDLERGRQILDEYLEAEGSSASALALVGSAFVTAGRPAWGVAYFARAEEAAGEEAEARRHAAQRAIALAEEGRIETAREILEGLVERDPDSGALRLALMRYVHQPRNDHEATLAMARDWRKRRPESRAARMAEIEALIQTGRLEAATELVEIRREEEPDAVDLLGYRLWALSASGSRELALDEALAFAATDAADLPSILLLAERLRMGEAEAEAAILLKAVRDRYASHPMFDFSLGVAQERAGQSEEAMEALRRAIENDPSFHSAMNYLGYTMVERGGDLKEARALIERALVLDPNNPAYLDSLGWALLMMGQVDAAGEPLETAARRVPHDPVVRMHLARLREEQGRSEEALEGYLWALDNGLQERVEETRRRVRDLGGTVPGDEP